MATAVISITKGCFRTPQQKRDLMYPVLSGVPDVLFDQQFLNALRDRNTDAEDLLVSHFSRPVQLKLRARLRSPELVQDACQEAFLRVLNYFRSGKTLDNPASLPGFIHSVCHNISLEMLRAHTRHDQLFNDVPDPPDPRLNPESQMVTTERKELVKRILDEMPERDRRLLKRVFLEEEDKDLVCQEFQVDRSYLRVLVHRARTKFRAIALSPGIAGTASARSASGG
jgi:RNA polymerase sigma-70 factor (ECF subfamily)